MFPVRCFYVYPDVCANEKYNCERIIWKQDEIDFSRCSMVKNVGDRRLNNFLFAFAVNDSTEGQTKFSVASRFYNK